MVFFQIGFFKAKSVVIINFSIFQDCKIDIGGFSKDLTVISPDLSKIFILDNSPGAYRGNPGNTVLFIIVIQKFIMQIRQLKLIDLICL